MVEGSGKEVSHQCRRPWDCETYVSGPPRTSQDITICFSTTKKLMSGVIRWATGGKFLVPASPSHALISHYDVSLGRRMVLQAEAWGFEHRTWERFEKDNILIAQFAPIGPDLEESLQWISSYLGADYDFVAAFLVGLKKFTGRAIKGRFSDPRKLMCSEAVIRMLDHAGYASVRDLDPETTSPLELMRRLFTMVDEFRLWSAIPKASARYREM